MMELSTKKIGAAAYELHYYRAGDGEPLLYLHHMLGMIGFEPMLARLAESFDVIAPYAPGWGPAKDDLPLCDPGPLDLTLHHCDVLDAFGIDSACVFGASIGGWMAAELAAIAPARVRRLALLNPLGLWLDDVGGEDPFAQHPGYPSTVLFSDRGMREQYLIEGRDKLDAHVEELLNLRASAKFLWPIPDTGIDRRLARISAPTLVVTSDADVVVPPAYGTAWCAGIADAKLETINGAGHLAGLEQPDRIADLVTGFFAAGDVAAVA